MGDFLKQGSGSLVKSGLKIPRSYSSRKEENREKRVLGVISFCVNNSIAVDRIRILRSNKVYFFDNYISSNCFIGNIITEIVKVSSKENTALHNQILL